MINSYSGASDFFKASGDKVSTILSKDTLLLKDRNVFVITLHGMKVLTFHKNGNLTLFDDDCGTAELRNLFNKYTPDCVNVIQRKFQFYVDFFGIIAPFIDGQISLDIRKKEVSYASTNFGV